VVGLVKLASAIRGIRVVDVREVDREALGRDADLAHRVLGFASVALDEGAPELLSVGAQRESFTDPAQHA